MQYLTLALDLRRCCLFIFKYLSRVCLEDICLSVHLSVYVKTKKKCNVHMLDLDLGDLFVRVADRCHLYV